MKAWNIVPYWSLKTIDFLPIADSAAPSHESLLTIFTQGEKRKTINLLFMQEVQ